MQTLSRQHDYRFPHIERLRQDFGLQLSRIAEGGNHAFSLVVEFGAECRPLTPGFAAVAELEDYAAAHMTDILHDYLCSSGSEPE